MKQMHKLLVISLSAVFLLGMAAFVVPQPVSAAAAKCYVVGSGGSDSYGNGGLPTGLVNCNSYPPALIDTLPNGIRADHCYAAGLSIIEYPMPSADCTDLADQSTATQQGPDALPGGSANANSTGQDIFGTSREDLQDCRGAECVNNNPITKMVIYAINILSAVVGIVVVGVIISAGIQYSASGGNPQVTAQAKKRIINAIIALVVYFFLFAILQWLVPGGLLKR